LLFAARHFAIFTTACYRLPPSGIRPFEKGMLEFAIADFAVRIHEDLKGCSCHFDTSTVLAGRPTDSRSPPPSGAAQRGHASEGER
jgi:hypothetical protein